MLASRGRRDAQQVVYPLQPALYKFSLLLFAPTFARTAWRGLRSRAQPASRRHHRLLDLTCACNPRQYASNGSREAALATTCTRPASSHSSPVRRPLSFEPSELSFIQLLNSYWNEILLETARSFLTTATSLRINCTAFDILILRRAMNK